MKLITLMLSVAFSLATTAWAGYEKGTEYANGGQLQEAIAEFEEGASRGEAMSQWALGTHYYVGDGKPQDFKKAFELFSAAAENGSAEAHYFLSSMYYKGEYVKKDPGLVFQHTKAAAEKCLPKALNDYSFYFYEGDHVKKDLKMAAALLLVSYWIGDDESLNHFNTVMKKLPSSSINEVKSLHHALIEKYNCQTQRPDFD